MRSNQLQRLELAAKNWRTFGLEPAFQNVRIDTAKIYSEFDVALEQIPWRKAGITSKQSGFHLVTDDEQRCGSTVVGAAAGVLESWLKTKSAPILGRQFEPLQLV